MKNKLMLSMALLVVTAVCATAGDAKALYEKSCKKCHGEDGTGQTVMGKKLGCKDYTDAKVQDAMKDDAAIKSLKEGLKSEDGKILMKPFEDLSDEDVKGLVEYMRSFKK